VICKIGICGASGKMGIEIAALAQAKFQFRGTHFELADAVAQSHKVRSVEGVPVRTLAEPEKEPVHVWIDFSRPEATVQLLRTIQTPIVIGTTGFSPEQWSVVEDYAQKHPVLFAPNMSPGMNALFEMVEQGALTPALGFEVVASEIHHKHKKDSPSGTMKRWLQSLESVGFQNTPVQASRAGEVFGVHSLKFISADEEITIDHRVLNRRVFARGALLATEFILRQKKSKIYSYGEVLKS
jgi:4-hydroxy-tetrahydrodipicolinate reductase